MADEKTLEVFAKLLREMPANQTKQAFVSIYLKRGGLVHGKKYSRVAVVSFPLYEELIKGNDTVYGVKLRKKDIQAITNLLDYLFPNIGGDCAYWHATDSVIAPYLEALMGAVMKVGSSINDTVELFRNCLANPDKLTIASDWVEDFEKLPSMQADICLVPNQAGGEGSALKEAPAPTLAPAVATPTVAPAATYAPTAPAATAPMFPQQAQPMFPGYGQQPVAAPPQAGIRKTANGLDFASVLASVPGVAQQFAPPPVVMGGIPQTQGPMYGGGFPQQQQQPMGSAFPQYATNVGFNYPNGFNGGTLF
jgi:hypothetical protein